MQHKVAGVPLLELLIAVEKIQCLLHVLGSGVWQLNFTVTTGSAFQPRTFMLAPKMLSTAVTPAAEWFLQA